MKHTKGPWIINKTDNAIRRLTGAKTPSEVEANARLISAGPELYEAAVNIFNIFNNDMLKNKDFVRARQRLAEVLDKIEEET